MEHHLTSITAADGERPHDWVAQCSCGDVTETPRRDPSSAFLDHCRHEARAQREERRVPAGPVAA